MLYTFFFYIDVIIFIESFVFFLVKMINYQTMLHLTIWLVNSVLLQIKIIHSYITDVKDHKNISEIEYFYKKERFSFIEF